MGTAQGLSVTGIGLGMLIAGVGVLRAGAWSGVWRWTPSVIGIAAFALVTPGMFGGFVIARLAIEAWMLVFAALGWTLASKAGVPVPRRPRPDVHEAPGQTWGFAGARGGS